MKKEIILVEVVNGYDLSTDYCRCFSNTVSADEYFRTLVGRFNITDNEDDIDCFIEDGFCDFDYEGEKMSIITKCVIYEED
jgi:hypothetical protein